MSKGLFIVVSLLEILSLILIVKLWRSNEHITLKIIGTVTGIIPFLGLFLLLFMFSPQPQPEHLQNRGPRGSYKDSFNAMKSVLKASDSVETIGEAKSNEEK